MSAKLPPGLIASLKEQKGFDEKAFVAVHENGDQLTSIRLNPAKPITKFTDEMLVPWGTDGRYLIERPSFTADPLFHAGCYYVQEASCMFLEQALRQTVDLDDELKILDLCAAPGGKSTLISSLINGVSLLLSNEVIKTRVDILCDNLNRWGKSNSYVSNNDPKDFNRLEGYFDVVLADAPCSGSGMFRKDPAAIEEWSEDSVMLCSQRQQRILADVYPALKKDGILIYSTCSYSEAENEEIADWLMGTFGMETIRLNIDPDWGIVETKSKRRNGWGYRFYPDRLNGEGFFVACFRKKEKESEVSLKSRKQEIVKYTPAHLVEIKNWLKPDNSVAIKNSRDVYFGIPAGQEADLALLQENLYLRKAGTRLGKFAGKDFIPDHELALSLIASENIHRINLDREPALAYLKKAEIKLNTDLSGWVLMCYEGFALGWAKVLPNRINNYYPKELRIINPAIR